MSEYWKSTPKYWCKHCKTFVKDTKIEKQNHEATGRHQGNLQRFIRGLHKDNEREAREKQRAKDEVNRLNGVARSNPITSGLSSTVPASSASNHHATPADRKRQLQQLADMGIAVPEDFRRETAMAGEWEVTSQRLIYENASDQPDGLKKEEDDDDGDSKTAIGVRKRKHEDDDEDGFAGARAPRKGWGTSVRSMPGSNREDDLDALLGQAKPKVKIEHDSEGIESINVEPTENIADGAGKADGGEVRVNESSTDAKIKQEILNPGDHAEMDGALAAEAITAGKASKEPSKAADGIANSPPPVLFKKRKAKPAR